MDARDHIEDDLFPVDGVVLVGDAEHGHLTAVTEVVEDVLVQRQPAGAAAAPMRERPR